MALVRSREFPQRSWPLKKTGVRPLIEEVEQGKWSMRHKHDKKSAPTFSPSNWIFFKVKDNTRSMFIEQKASKLEEIATEDARKTDFYEDRSVCAMQPPASPFIQTIPYSNSRILNSLLLPSKYVLSTEY